MLDTLCLIMLETKIINLAADLLNETKVHLQQIAARHENDGIFYLIKQGLLWVRREML